MSFLGVSHLHPIILPLVPCPFWGIPSPSHNTSTGPMSFLGEYPSDWSQVKTGREMMGYPHPGQDGEGYPIIGYPIPSRDGYPLVRSRWGVPLTQGWGTPRDRTADGVLDMPQSVCLLRLIRSTFLFL